ncbi:MAG: hypothetical protein GXO16_07560 [Epsilonproteobacteria bacterium]|nr:hypothetical protein [Campylobacterota bacterium]
MRFYIFLKENDQVIDAITYENEWRIDNIKPVDPQEFLNNTKLQSSYYTEILNSDEILFYQLEFPKNLKKNLKYLQIENYYISRLEESGLNPQDYTFFTQEFPSHTKKGFVTIYLYILPKHLVESELPLNEIYLLYDFFIVLANRSKNGDLYAVVHQGPYLTTSLIFYKRQLEFFQVSYNGIPFDPFTLKELVQDKLSLELKDENIFIFSKEEFPLHYFEFLKLKKLGKTIQKYHQAFPNIDIVLFFPKLVPAKPIVEKEPIRHYLSPKTFTKIFLVTTLLALGLMGGAIWYYFFVYAPLQQKIRQLQREIEDLNLALSETRSQLSRYDLSNLTFIKKLKKLKVPTYVEADFVINRTAKELGAKVINLHIEPPQKKKKRRSSSQKETKSVYKAFIHFPTKEQIPSFEQNLSKVPLIKELQKEILLTNPDGGFLAAYKITLKEVKYVD